MPFTLARLEAAAREPRFDTLEEARAVYRDLTLDEYALARVINSEADRRPVLEQACIADSDVNRARDRGRSLFDYITNGSGQFGGQGRGDDGVTRLQSSARPPGPKHVEVALAVLRRSWKAWPFLLPPLLGVSRGARQYFNPKVQDAMHAKDPASHSCSALGLLRAWTFDTEKCGARRCCAGGAPAPDARRGRAQMEWVGPIPGVDAYQLMLIRPATANQGALYAEAVKVIESKGAYQGRRMPVAPVDLAIVAVLVGAGYLLAQGALG